MFDGGAQLAVQIETTFQYMLEWRMLCKLIKISLFQLLKQWGKNYKLSEGYVLDYSNNGQIQCFTVNDLSGFENRQIHSADHHGKP